MNDFRFALWTTLPIIKENHIMSHRRTVADSHSNVRIPPFFNHETAAELSAKRINLILIDSHNASDSHMVVRPTGRFVARKTNIERYSTVMLLHQPNIRFGEFVSQFTFCFFYHLFCRRCANIFIHSIFIIIPEVYKVKILKRFVFHNRCF